MIPGWLHAIAWGCIVSFRGLRAISGPRYWRSVAISSTLRVYLQACHGTEKDRNTQKNMMDTLPKERYEPPEIEILQVAVETGFATSDTESGLPTWDKEDGYWQ